MRTGVKIGLGVLTIAGTHVTINWSEKILNKVEREVTRYKTKKVVKNKFNGNEKLLNIVDDLSDNELDSLSQIVKSVKTSREKMKDMRKKIKDSAGIRL
ncbi:hypothetical protein KUA55_17250 [Enterococcus sp. ALS3]|uniref:Uncharacterized protein n=1 Tax=Enterococcus alishanensis TaxID=1303817 RepID=A0ABS6THN2_9ENTE|nr:hypothetical protein [Enterococcus alishanensis]MBV7392408.1 hypothetical protein [Enterococcus alishanensis]